MWASNFIIFFFYSRNFSFNNLRSRDAPCPFTSGNGNPFASNTSFANLPPNIFEPPSTIVTSITSLSFKGKCFMVDELATIDIVEVLNGLVVIQPKKNERLNGKSIGFTKNVGLQKFHG